MNDEDDLVDDCREFARCAAGYAHNCCFATRRGFLTSDPHFIVAFDNSPESGRSRRRERDLTALRKAAANLGLSLTAEASYPVGGENDGYTIALVWTLVNNQQQKEVIEVLKDSWNAVAIA